MSITPYTSARRKARLQPTVAAVRLALYGMGAAGVGAAACFPVQAAETTELRAFDIPAGPLNSVLTRIAGEAGVLLSFDPALVAGKSGPAVRGNFTFEQAIQQALQGSGLQLITTSGGTFTLQTLTNGEATTLPTMQVSGIITGDALANREHLYDFPAEPGGLKADYQASASKTPLSIRETPQAITVVTRESMDKRQPLDITSALELTAGLVPSSGSTIGGPFAGRGLETNEQFSLRGMDLDGQRDIRIDGFAVASPQLDLALFERVEVVKGPSSTLYGQGSLGGFINFVRKKPQAENQTSAVGQVGSWSTYRAELDSTGALNEEGDVLGRFIAVYDDSESFIEGVWDKSTVLAPSIEWRLGEQTRLLVDMLYQDDEFVPSHGIPLFVNGDELETPDIRRELFVGAPSVHDSYLRTRMINARLDNELSDRWLGSLVLQKGKQQFARYFDNYGHGGLEANGDTPLYADTYSSNDDFWAGEVRLDGTFDAFGREHQLLVGADRNYRSYDSTFAYQYVGMGNIYTEQFPTDGTTAKDLPLSRWSGYRKNTGVYAQTLLTATEKTKLLAGLRHDVSEQNGDNDALKSEATTVRLGVTHNFSNHITGYAMYGQSFNPVTAMTFDNKLLDPERGSGYELGLKTEWYEGRMGVNLAVYQQDLDNRPIPDPLHANGSISGGLQRNVGVELEINGSPMPGLDISAGIGWGDSEYTDKQDSEYGLVPYGFIGENAGIYASYEWQEGQLQGFGIGATYTYIGKRSFAYAGLATAGWVDNATTDQLWFEGFDRTDLHFYYSAIPDWDFSLQIRNVFDNVYIERMRDIESNNYFGSPRAYLLRVKHDF